LPLDSDSSSSAPPTNWCSACRKQTTINPSTTARDGGVSPGSELCLHLHKDEAREARSALGDPLVPCKIANRRG
jgi:hypothetical protein